MPWAWCQPVPTAHECPLLGNQPGCGWMSGPGGAVGTLFREQCPEGRLEFLFCHLPMSVPGASTADVSVPCPSGLQGRCLPTGILWLRGWWWLGTGGHLQPWECVGP